MAPQGHIDAIRPIWLVGWSYYSTWGFDTAANTYYAQLYPDDDPDRGDGEPNIWIGGRGPVVETVEELAQEISSATAIPSETVLAMLNADPGSDEEASFAREAQP